MEVVMELTKKTTIEARLDAVRELADLSLPVADYEVMERESVPAAEDLLP
jgi:hypothetical protein